MKRHLIGQVVLASRSGDSTWTLLPDARQRCLRLLALAQGGVFPTATRLRWPVRLEEDSAAQGWGDAVCVEEREEEVGSADADTVRTTLVLSVERGVFAPIDGEPFGELGSVGRQLLDWARGPGDARDPALDLSRLPRSSKPLWVDVDPAGATSVTLDTRGESLPLGPGLIAVMGPTGAGKSTLVTSLMDGDGPAGRYEFVRWGEPDADAAGLYTIRHLEQALSQAFEHYQVVVLDSAKNLLLTSENQGKGGISLAFQAKLSTWAATLRRAGRTLIVTANTLTLDDEQRSNLLQSLGGNVTSVLYVTRGHGASGPSVVVSSRTWADRRPRTFGHAENPVLRLE